LNLTRAPSSVDPQEYYDSDWQESNDDPMTAATFTTNCTVPAKTRAAIFAPGA